jgi:hypothetical protein
MSRLNVLRAQKVWGTARHGGLLVLTGDFYYCNGCRERCRPIVIRASTQRRVASASVVSSAGMSR